MSTSCKNKSTWEVIVNLSKKRNKEGICQGHERPQTSFSNEDSWVSGLIRCKMKRSRERLAQRFCLASKP